MKCCLVLLLLGILVAVGVGAYPPGSCDGYTNISQAWRNGAFHSPYFLENPYDDSFMVSQWWRFVGPSGDIVVTMCKTVATGNLYSIGMEGFEMPTTQLSTAKRVTAYSYSGGNACKPLSFFVDVVLCPGGFYVYKPLSHPASSGYTTWHSSCGPDVCGPHAECFLFTNAGLCQCLPGYSIETKTRPPDDVFCIDIDECEVEDICANANCTNYEGGYNCSCFNGYEPTLPTEPATADNQCTDIDECLNATACDENGVCGNTQGSYTCVCNSGFYSVFPACKDIDECLNETVVCGPNAVCNNTIGDYDCSCEVGYRQAEPTIEASATNICLDINECVEDITICGSNGDCTNTDGSFFCTCFSGYRLYPDLIGTSDPCLDIDECTETPDICGPKSFCVNKPGTFTCACSDRFFSSTGIIWTVETVCESIPDILNAFTNSKEKTKEKAFFAKMDKQLKKSKGDPLHEAIVTNSFSASMEVAGVGPYVIPPKVSSAGNGEIGTIILDLSERLIEGLLQNDDIQSTVEIQTSTLELSGMMFNPEDYKPKSFSLTAGGISMEINIEDLASKNNDYAAVSLMKLNGLDSLLSHQYFETENITQFAADIFSAFLPSMNNTNLTDPVNFTILHEKMPGDGQMTCTYWKADKMVWEDDENDEGLSAAGSWSEEGCWVSYAAENYTVCTCSHLSTFALIMQIGEPPPQSDFLDWLNRICVIIGLFFFTLAILTFLLCSWNPKINNTARLHLCINLGLSHLLLLLNEQFYADSLACKAIAGILHFLVVCSFVWMSLEAVQLYMLVRRLNKVQVIERDGLPKLVLYLIGYGVPFVIVGVSALVYNEGYGGTGAKVCWLSTTRNFNWALTGPVITILALNLALFCATLWSLRTTLANMRKGASESKDAKLVLFKIVAQFVILGCTWILGLYQTNLFFQILFIVLNSQQGTFLYVVHCLLNREIREECLKCLSCSHSRKKDTADGGWTTEEQDSTR